MKKRSFIEYQLPVLFVFILFLPMLNSQFKFWEFERFDENRTFNDSLSVDFPNSGFGLLPEVKWQKEKKSTGIHFSNIGISSLFEMRQVPKISNFKSIEAVKYDFPPIEGFAYPQLYEVRYVNENLKNGLKVLFIRDSFGEQLIPFTRDLFKESVYIFDAWQYKLNENIIREVKPDVVIFLGLETHIKNYLDSYN